MVIDLSSPNGTYDPIFLSNFATINLNDQILRVPGIGNVVVFGAGQYAMRMWVKPDQLAKLNITVPEIVDAIQPAEHGQPGRPGRRRARAAGSGFHLLHPGPGAAASAEEFGQIVLRAEPDGSLVRLKDVARIELGAQNYSMVGRLNGKAAAAIAVYQLPGSNAIAAVDGVKKLMEQVEADLSARPGVHHRPGHHRGRARGHQGDHPHPVRSAGAGDHRRIHLPAGLARHPDPGPGGAGFADRHLRGVSADRLFGEHHRHHGHGAGHRAGGGRRHRGGGGRGASHRARALAQGGHAQGHGGGLRAGGGHRPGALGRVSADGLHPGHHGQALPAVCRDHRHLGAHFGVQRPVAQPGALFPDPEAEKRNARTAGGLLPLVQPRLRQIHQRLCARQRLVYPQGRHQPAADRRDDRGIRLDRQAGAGRVSARRRPGLSLRAAAAARRRIAAAHGRGRPRGREDHHGDPGCRIRHERGGLEPALRNDQYLQRLFLRVARSPGTSARAPRRSTRP